MSKMFNAMVVKGNEMCATAVTKVSCMMSKKKRGSADTFIVMLILIGIAVAIAYVFKDQIISLLQTVFKSISSEITNGLMAEPS